jgi:hypothetical protein
MGGSIIGLCGGGGGYGPVIFLDHFALCDFGLA